MIVEEVEKNLKKQQEDLKEKHDSHDSTHFYLLVD